jgi:hypothetical protein
MSVKWYMTEAELAQDTLDQTRIWSRLDELWGGFCPGEISCQFRTPTAVKVYKRLKWWQQLLCFEWLVPGRAGHEGLVTRSPDFTQEMADR